MNNGSGAVGSIVFRGVAGEESPAGVGFKLAAGELFMSKDVYLDGWLQQGDPKPGDTLNASQKTRAKELLAKLENEENDKVRGQPVLLPYADFTHKFQEAERAREECTLIKKNGCYCTVS